MAFGPNKDNRLPQGRSAILSDAASGVFAPQKSFDLLQVPIRLPTEQSYVTTPELLVRGALVRAALAKAVQKGNISLNVINRAFEGAGKGIRTDPMKEPAALLLSILSKVHRLEPPQAVLNYFAKLSEEKLRYHQPQLKKWPAGEPKPAVLQPDEDVISWVATEGKKLSGEIIALSPSWKQYELHPEILLTAIWSAIRSFPSRVYELLKLPPQKSGELTNFDLALQQAGDALAFETIKALVETSWIAHPLATNLSKYFRDLPRDSIEAGGCVAPAEFADFANVGSLLIDDAKDLRPPGVERPIVGRISLFIKDLSRIWGVKTYCGQDPYSMLGSSGAILLSQIPGNPGDYFFFALDKPYYGISAGVVGGELRNGELQHRTVSAQFGAHSIKMQPHLWLYRSYGGVASLQHFDIFRPSDPTLQPRELSELMQGATKISWSRVLQRFPVARQLFSSTERVGFLVVIDRGHAIDLMVCSEDAHLIPSLTGKDASPVETTQLFQRFGLGPKGDWVTCTVNAADKPRP